MNISLISQSGDDSGVPKTRTRTYRITGIEGVSIEQAKASPDLPQRDDTIEGGMFHLRHTKFRPTSETEVVAEFVFESIE